MIKKIKFIIPCKNEELNINLIYNLINKIILNKTVLFNLKYQYEFSFLFVDDGSSDDTINEIKKLKETNKDKNNIEYISLSRNFGKESAMMAGLEESKHNCDAVIFMDADGQDNPIVIVQMLKEYEKGYNDIYGKRINRNDNNFFESFLSNTFYKLINKFSKYNKIPEEVGDFRLLDKECINALLKLKEKNRYTKGLFSFIGFKKKEIKFFRPNRNHGKTKWNLRKKLSFSLDAIVSFTNIIYIIPFYLFLLSLIPDTFYLIYNFNNIFINNNVYKLIVFLFLLTTSLIILCSTIILRILFYILEETKNRPLYFKKNEKKMSI